MTAAALLSLLLTLAGDRLAAQSTLPLWPAEAPWPRVSGQTRLVPDTVLGLVMDGDVGPDGSACVLDAGMLRVHCFAPDGRLRHSYGRKGGGPGEFTTPYRLAALPDGGSLVYDRSTQALLRFSSAGSYLTRYRLPMRLDQVDDMVALSADTIAIAGVALAGGRAAPFGVHILALRDSAQLVLSFGDLPTARNTRHLGFWGAGGLSRTPNGTLLYARRVPYEVTEFSRDGRRLRQWHGPVALTFGADEFITIETTRTRTRFGMNRDPRIQRPLTAYLLPGDRLLGGRQRSDDVVWWWDLFESDTATVAGPTGYIAHLFGLSPDRGVAWFTFRDDESGPSVWRVVLGM